ncbi:uncharacterized protein N7506_008934 [Penicillium brevicompactum]|uniref:uncharacterized protein n=1 Tax=Penicillium brevicompactum TaxID=5074 RepID=UPI002540B7C9|nr:uncharacterized protein N7506_008934 [Penicillium brevicompactum]KAJ5325832.1 hypothetical protein N7506_008934 [Penicillium brevicompactum]
MSDTLRKLVVSKTLDGHTGWIWDVTPSRNGELASVSNDMTIRLWNTNTGLQRGPAKDNGHSNWVRAVRFSPSGRLLATASDDMTVRIRDAITGFTYRTLQGHTGKVRVVEFSPDGTTLASASDDFSVRLWNAGGRAPFCGFSKVTPVGYALWLSRPMERRLLRLPMIILFVCGIQPLASKFTDSSIRAVCFSQDGRLLVSGSQDKTLCIWDVTSGNLLNVLKGHSGPLRLITFSADGRLIATAADDLTIRLWAVQSGSPLEISCLGVVTGYSGWVRAIKLENDGNMVVYTSDDMTIKIWESA